MGEVVELSDFRPHMVIKDHKGNAHVVPASVFIDIAKGEKTVDCLDDRDALMRVIVSEWLRDGGVPGADGLLETVAQT